MRLTQGTFSYLPDLTDEQIRMQIAQAVSAFMTLYGPKR